MFLTIYSISILGNENNNIEEDFYVKYNQPRTAQGSPEDFKKFWETGDCNNCNLKGFDLRNVIKKYENKSKTIYLTDSDCSGANLSNVNLSAANLQHGIFDNANFENSNLEKVLAGICFFRHANMQNTNMRNATLLEANFQEANLTGANLEGANASFANMQNTNMSNTNLKKTTFQRAEINKATSFKKAICESTDFSYIDGEADFSEATLTNCKMDSTTLFQKIVGIFAWYSRTKEYPPLN